MCFLTLKVRDVRLVYVFFDLSLSHYFIIEKSQQIKIALSFEVSRKLRPQTLWVSRKLKPLGYLENSDPKNADFGVIKYFCGPNGSPE